MIPNGIDLAGYAPLPAKPGPPVIGFLARMCREKGLEIMVDAFIHLRTVLGHPDARLHLAGAATADNEPLIASLQAAAGGGRPRRTRCAGRRTFPARTRPRCSGR